MKITLITPSYNAIATIRDTIDSVRRQRLPAGVEIEHLIVDGGSSDGTESLATLSEADDGLYDAINKGLRRATGDVIGILNADDVLAEDDTIARIAAAFAEAGVEAVYADVRFVRGGESVEALRRAPTVRYCTGRFFRNWMFRFATFPAHPSTFVRKACYDRCGLYSLDYPICADFEMMLRLFYRNGVRARYLPVCTTVMRTGGVSTRNLRANFEINREDLRALRANGVWSCLPLVYCKYFAKVWGLVFRRRAPRDAGCGGGSLRAGLLGRKLGHSLSPQIHAFFGDGDYRLFECEPGEVAAFVRGGFARGDFDFLNVTIPYKRTVFALCDEHSALARRLGNVNFVRRLSDGRLYGDNTDAFGFGRLVDSVGAAVAGRCCAILGAGGAAQTAKAVLEERGARRVSFVRRGETPARDDALIVNATPVGMFPDVGSARIDISRYPACETVLDLVYNPSPTRLVREARACGKTAADGLVMLVAQAYRSFLGLRPPAGGREPPTLFLYGPPASGKSTWARRIAAATGWVRVDLDEEIAKAAGRSVPEIFAAGGEAAFRRVERRCLRAVCADRRGCRVVALGGGALLDARCRRMAEAAGRVVVLDCPPEVLKSRLTDGSRPLSADAASLEALVAARAAHYGSFPRRVRLT